TSTPCATPGLERTRTESRGGRVLAPLTMPPRAGETFHPGAPDEACLFFIHRCLHGFPALCRERPRPGDECAAVALLRHRAGIQRTVEQGGVGEGEVRDPGDPVEAPWRLSSAAGRSRR